MQRGRVVLQITRTNSQSIVIPTVLLQQTTNYIFLNDVSKDLSMPTHKLEKVLYFSSLTRQVIIHTALTDIPFYRPTVVLSLHGDYICITETTSV